MTVPPPDGAALRALVERTHLSRMKPSPPRRTAVANMPTRDMIADTICQTEYPWSYSIRLTRLVDGEATYTLTYDDGLALEFEDSGEANAHVRQRQRDHQADAILALFASALGGDGAE